MTIIDSRSFSPEDQQAFADASGDRNPVHVDAEYARRTMFGDVLVHGVHALMWALDRWVAQGGSVPRSFRVQFAKPVYTCETVAVIVREEANNRTLILTADSVPLVTVALDATVNRPEPLDSFALARWSIASCVLGRAEIKGMASQLPAEPGTPALAAMFPALDAALGSRACGTLASLSRLVGMECPGRQSLFAGMAVVFEHGNPATSLSYQVRRSEPPIAPIELTFRGPDLAGTVSAFFRPTEFAQPSMQSLQAHMAGSEFAGHRALVVGGSRGLGELTAKLLATGGADVVITYAVGRMDAERVQREIEIAGMRCTIRRLDVLRSSSETQRCLEEAGPFETAYYFATPHITGRRAKPFEPEKLRYFEKYFVDGFADFCHACATLANPPAVFFPSTVFLDEPNRDNVEYAVAKAAGEALGRHVTAGGAVRVIDRRLPRMETDQTRALLQPKFENSVAVMREVVLQVQRARG